MLEESRGWIEHWDLLPGGEEGVLGERVDGRKSCTLRPMIVFHETASLFSLLKDISMFYSLLPLPWIYHKDRW
jgi:hypothetical protein